jgi:hypothetical protein
MAVEPTARRYGASDDDERAGSARVRQEHGCRPSVDVCTPDELDEWPIDAWVLLECGDDERRQRLAKCLDPAEVEAALADAHRYRTLGLPVIDSTGRAPEAVAVELAHLVRNLEASKAR